MPVLITPTTLSSFPSNRPVVQKPGPRFGAMLVPQIFRLLEQNPIVDTLAKDILGFNIPKLALSRTKQEFWDIAPLEFGNTTITVVSTLFLPALLRYPVKAMSNLKSMRPLLGDVTEKLTSQAKLARLGVSFGFMFMFAGAFWAMPFYNAIEQLTKGSLQRKLKLLKGRQDMTSFGITICMLAFSPQLLNIYLTRKRLEAEKLAHLKRYQTLLNQPV